jgi:leader peptidase (prepilin peptidase)/N-methyltransferase
MISILTVIFFILGLIIGSFLNVVILRMNTSRSLGGRSACMSCLHRLEWYELIPLVSFIVLRGRCKNCQTKISAQYPVVELLSGIISATLFWKFQNTFFISGAVFTAAYAYYALMFSLLLVIGAYDFRHKIIPDKLSFAFAALALSGLFFTAVNSFSGYSDSPLFYWHVPSVLDFLSGVVIALPFVFLWFVSKGRWMGLGDGKLAIGLGWFLGFERAFSSVVLAFWIGAVVGLGLIFFTKNYGMKSEIPFAIFMVLGVFLIFLFNFRIFPSF